jgi:hypothetical protein
MHAREDAAVLTRDLRRLLTAWFAAAGCFLILQNLQSAF